MRCRNCGNEITNDSKYCTACGYFDDGLEEELSDGYFESVEEIDEEDLKDKNIPEEEILDYLTLRKNIVNGITISGGEPTLQKDLKDFIKKVKKIGVDVKLDTNGINYELLKELIDEKLIDYVAMDIKNVPEKYGLTSGVSKIKLDSIKKSMELLKENKVDYEFRTTIINEHHTLQDILEIVKEIGDSKYFLQNFRMSDDVIDRNLNEVPNEKLILWNKILKKYKNVFIRGMNKED